MDGEIKSIINKLVLADATPGVTYRVISGGKLFEGALGLRSKYGMNDNHMILEEEKNDINTIYDIASLTKVVCTVPIIFRLHEQGKLDLNDKVSKYLPNFKHADISIYDLLTHTSGLPADLGSKEIVPREKIIEKLYSLDLVNKKGEFVYSDVGYMILGLMIENIYGKSLDKVFEEEVTMPLDMANTCFNPKNIELIAPTELTRQRGVVRGIVHDEKSASMGGIAGHAGVFSTAEDLSNFTTMILNNGMFKGKKYLDKSTIEKWFTPLEKDRDYYRSYSWFVGCNPNIITKNSNDIISFHGFTGPSISMDKKTNTTIIMMTNRVHPTRDNKRNTNMRSDITNQIYKAVNKNIIISGNSNDINYDGVKETFDKYIDECKKRIKDTFFKEDELSTYKTLRDNLVRTGKLDSNSSLESAIKYERLQMIDTKINHTMRVVEDVIKIAEKMGTSVNFNNVLKVAALLHDIGRFDQATWNDSFRDSCYKDIAGINNHAEAGYHILFTNERIKDYPIDKRFYKAIGTVVYNHGNSKLEGDLAIRLKDASELDISKLSGLDKLNVDEKVIVAALVQMVRDVDMLDILYQHLTGEFPVIREEVNFKTLGESIDKIASYWEVEPSVLLEYNHITEDELKLRKTIKIPVNKINLNKLSVPKDIKMKFFAHEDMNLGELMERRDFTFIIGMWWRLNHFLSNINFTSNLQVVEEKNLLEKIYNQYPIEYRFLVRDAFEHANLELVKQKLEQNKSNIYIDSGKAL